MTSTYVVWGGGAKMINTEREIRVEPGVLDVIISGSALTWSIRICSESLACPCLHVDLVRRAPVS